LSAIGLKLPASLSIDQYAAEQAVILGKISILDDLRLRHTAAGAGGRFRF